jgi:hypothetical protein
MHDRRRLRQRIDKLQDPKRKCLRVLLQITLMRSFRSFRIPHSEFRISHLALWD